MHFDWTRNQEKSNDKIVGKTLKTLLYLAILGVHFAHFKKKLLFLEYQAMTDGRTGRQR